MAVKRFTCTECGSKCMTKAKLIAHKKIHESISEEKSEFVCEVCGKRFSSQSILKRHKKNCQYSCKNLVIGSKENKEYHSYNNAVKVVKCNEVDTSKETSPDVPSSSDDKALIGNSIEEKNVTNSLHEMCSKVQTLLDSSKHRPTENVSCVAVTNKNATTADIVNLNQLMQNSLHSINGKKMCISQNIGNKQKPRCQSKSQLPNSSISARKESIKGLNKISSKKKSVLQCNRSHNMGTRNVPKRDRNTSNAKKKSNSDIGTIKRQSPISKSSLLINKGNEMTLELDEANKQLSICAMEISKELLKGGENRNKTSEEQKNDIDTKKDVAEEIEMSDDDQAASPVSDTTDGKKHFTCPQCTKGFSRKYHLDRHLKLSPCSGLPPLAFPCQVCDRVYSRKDNLREHLRQHTGEPQRVKKHRCSYCNKAFHGQSLLTIHIRTHTGEKPFGCDFCNKKFPSAGALSKHRRTHTGERPFECSECDLKFSLKGTLKRHSRVHTGVRPHKCKFCSKQFIQIGGLKAHMFYHTGENGFKCEECGKIFNRKARLQMHNLYVHVKHRPYVCEHCSKSFTRKEDLNRHNVLHTGEKPFKCPTCSKTFAIKPSLKLHLLTHTKEEPRSCHECGRAFIRKDCLLRHMRKRHRDLLDKILLDEKDEKYGDSNLASSRMLGEEDLCENITELLSLLVEESTLTGFGWPEKPVDEVLEAVIRRCGHTPVSPDQYSYMDRMRENAKLLFTVVIDDNAVKTLLNNQTVDEVILHVLRLAKT